MISQFCHIHTSRPAVGTCSICHRPICASCGNRVAGSVICAKCVERVRNETLDEAALAIRLSLLLLIGGLLIGASAYALIGTAWCRVIALFISGYVLWAAFWGARWSAVKWRRWCRRHFVPIGGVRYWAGMLTGVWLVGLIYGLLGGSIVNFSEARALASVIK